ncbi:hypothetical protein WJX73_006696 [Symbiochloris irregularis]|uniref:Uncharacterized protein n=1 Tax=Symbiochloris irregularis TaxID=706552 RepID=A0AAW1PVP2_9CHLO
MTVGDRTPSPDPARSGARQHSPWTAPRAKKKNRSLSLLPDVNENEALQQASVKTLPPGETGQAATSLTARVLDQPLQQTSRANQDLGTSDALCFDQRGSSWSTYHQVSAGQPPFAFAGNTDALRGPSQLALGTRHTDDRTREIVAWLGQLPSALSPYAAAMPMIMSPALPPCPAPTNPTCSTPAITSGCGGGPSTGVSQVPLEPLASPTGDSEGEQGTASKWQLAFSPFSDRSWERPAQGEDPGRGWHASPMMHHSAADASDSLASLSECRPGGACTDDGDMGEFLQKGVARRRGQGAPMKPRSISNCSPAASLHDLPRFSLRLQQALEEDEEMEPGSFLEARFLLVVVAHVQPAG